MRHIRHISANPLCIIASTLLAQGVLLTAPVVADEPRDEGVREQQQGASDARRQEVDARGKPSNDEIRAAIDDELYFDPLVSRADIDVAVDDGKVTLTGTTATLLSRERAGRIAEAVRGVQHVTNRVEVKPAARSDADALRLQVEQALRADPAAEAYEVHVSADAEGDITLTGAVDSWAEQRLAARVAAGVRGVTSVTNNVTIAAKAVRSNSEIRSDVENKLRWDRYVDEQLIEVAVDGGIVSLSGSVGSAAERTRALNLAWTAGVRSVDGSDLEVDPWMTGRESSQMKPTKKPDTEIASARRPKSSRTSDRTSGSVFQI